MKVLLLNQTFYPDVMATGQYLAELAVRLARQGHQVTVLTSRRAYDHPEQSFPAREVWRGVHIHRVACTGFGKTARWRRAADFASFLISACCRLALMPRFDTVVALTTPPLISFLGAWVARARGSRFYYWVMDFNPDEAIAAGWLRARSPAARVLEAMSRFSLRHASGVIALDRFMRDRIAAKGVPVSKIAVLPPWSQDGEVVFDRTAGDRFRAEHGLTGKYVVMYSGNHSPVHPLGTLIEAARRLRDEVNLVFCFVGGGSEWRKIQAAQQAGGPEALPNVRCLPYQPFQGLSASLSAADLHVVVMGDAMLGLVHPCKIYNILGLGAPVLYVGPDPSHVTELLRTQMPPVNWACLHHGQVGEVVQAVHRLSAAAVHQTPPAEPAWSRESVLPLLVRFIEGEAATHLARSLP